MKRLEVILKAQRGEIKWLDAALILNISPRHLRRIKEAYELHGPRILSDLRRGKTAWNRIKLEDISNICWLFKNEYFDYNVAHFHERLRIDYQINFSYTAVKSILQDAQLISRSKKRGSHRKRRERKPMKGLMLHLDGSTHRWFGAESGSLDLILILDDADSEIYEAFFVEQEDTLSCLEIIRRVIVKHGMFSSLYTDRGSHFFHTSEANKPVDASTQTQIQRALNALGVQMIPAYSPEARGRGERMWQTIQGRLPQELRRRGIRSKSDANDFLSQIFIPEMNQTFKIEPKEKKSGFVRVSSKVNLDLIFSRQSERTVGKDNIVQFNGQGIQIEPNRFRYSYAKCKVTVHELFDGKIIISYENKIIATSSAAKPLYVKIHQTRDAEETEIKSIENKAA